ncbi:hypothetical protein HYALB_00009281 [Hymenoscyphus albidus]|uniref:Uncharacterized protein n=1 Tax=Hymenoscyphus albidus TaxID=595503 RepID=A0A9N9LMG9_9HELO|nr:hypothetical protein HYALB_00009281 [Hymenoscyphus albidus]
MVYELKGRNVLVTGGSRGLGEVICIKFAQEGCNVAINYLASAEKSKTLAEKLEKDCGVKAIIIQADMGKEEDCIRTVQETISNLGGIDSMSPSSITPPLILFQPSQQPPPSLTTHSFCTIFPSQNNQPNTPKVIVSNAGYTRFSNFPDLTATTAHDWDYCYAVNVKAQHILLREASPTFKSNPEGGCLIMSSSIAATHPSGSSMPYSVTKAAQIHLMKCLAFTQGPKIRVNAVLPGLLLTEWVFTLSFLTPLSIKHEKWSKLIGYRASATPPK